MLIDRFGRSHTYLRIAVTDRCNLRCNYCMPPDGIELKPQSSILTYSEITRLAHIFVELGIRKLRITGGEPLVRSHIETLCYELSRINGITTLALSTNGILLGKKLDILYNAGVSELNISLDTLKEQRFKAITGFDNLRNVTRSVRSAVQFQSKAGLSFNSVKLNMVVRRGINDDELQNMIQFGNDLFSLTKVPPHIEVRFIEFMPQRGIDWDMNRTVSYNEMREIIERRHSLQEVSKTLSVSGPAKTFKTEGSALQVGFITSMSESFCSDCNRLRLTPDGHLRTCLFGADGPNLRDMLRMGATNEEIECTIKTALLEKWEEHPMAYELVALNDRDMVAIGG